MPVLARQLSLTPVFTALLYALAAAMTVFLITDALHLGVGIGERLAYMLVALLALLAVSPVLFNGVQKKTTVISVLLWLLLLSIWLIPSYWLTPSYLQYVAGDFASLALPALMLLLIPANRAELPTNRLTAIYVVLLLTAVLGAMLGAEQNRHEPPTTLVLALTIWWILGARSKPLKLGALLTGFMLSVLVITSGQRTALLVWLFLIAYLVIFSLRHWNIRSTVLMIPVMAGLLAVLATFPIGPTGVFSGHRAAGLSNLGKDESFWTRIEEIQDVARTIRQEGNLATLIIGTGHGGTYQPFRSHVKRNITPEGRVHNIHITPVMILFRYGLIGFLAYLWLLTKVLRVLVRAVVSPVRRPGIKLCYALACGGYLLEGLMFNVLVDPLFSLTLAFFLASQRPDHRELRNNTGRDETQTTPALQMPPAYTLER